MYSLSTWSDYTPYVERTQAKYALLMMGCLMLSSFSISFQKHNADHYVSTHAEQTKLEKEKKEKRK